MRGEINRMALRLPAISVNEGVARAVVAAFCAQMNPSATELADIKCAVSEAVTNCIVHAYRESEGDFYITVILFEGGLVRVAVRDRGCGIADVRAARAPLFTTDAEHERSGMGFVVMENFMDSLAVFSREGKGTTVVMTKRVGVSAERE
ncbi:MAG: anti-sigma F factor [Clostridia bacterium]|nr:anti-sigma F factor [Clostridia bacterium]